MESVHVRKGQQLFDPRRASRLMSEAGLDIIVASRRHTIAYLSGCFSMLYWEYPEVAHCLDREDDGCEMPYYFAGLPQDPEQSPFVIAHFNRTSLWKDCWIKDIKPCCYKPGKLSPVEQIVSGIEERGLDGETIGIEMNYIPAGLLRELENRLPRAVFKDASGVIWKMRMIKTKHELARQKEAYRIAQHIYEEVARLLRERPGITVGEVRGLQMALAAQAGCPPPHFGYVFPQNGVTKFPWRTGDPNVRIEKGDVVLLDLGLVYEGYTTDFGRGIVLGRASDEVRAMYQRTLEMRQVVASAVKPGVRACDVHKAGADFWEISGGVRPGFLGHGLGIECHEPPVLMADDETVLEEGMTIVIELVTNVGGIHFLLEDAGLVTNRGWESLTTMSPELIEIDY